MVMSSSCVCLVTSAHRPPYFRAAADFSFSSWDPWRDSEPAVLRDTEVEPSQSPKIMHGFDWRFRTEIKYDSIP